LLAAAGRGPEAQRELDLARLLGGAGPTGTALTLSSSVPRGLERVPEPSALSNATTLRTTVGGLAQRDQEATAAFHLNNARSLLVEGRDRDATGELRRAIYLSPYEEEPHRLLGGVHQRAGRLQEAVEAFTVALWCRETAAGRVALGAALFESGDRPGALREASRALVLDPGSTPARTLVERASP
jgi:tetratricopeptide (TPR) repeat protein